MTYIIHIKIRQHKINQKILQPRNSAMKTLKLKQLGENNQVTSKLEEQK